MTTCLLPPNLLPLPFDPSGLGVACRAPRVVRASESHWKRPYVVATAPPSPSDPATATEAHIEIDLNRVTFSEARRSVSAPGEGRARQSASKERAGQVTERAVREGAEGMTFSLAGIRKREGFSFRSRSPEVWKNKDTK